MKETCALLSRTFGSPEDSGARANEEADEACLEEEENCVQEVPILVKPKKRYRKKTLRKKRTTSRVKTVRTLRRRGRIGILYADSVKNGLMLDVLGLKRVCWPEPTKQSIALLVEKSFGVRDIAHTTEPRRRTMKRKVQKGKVTRPRKMPLSLVFNNMKRKAPVYLGAPVEYCGMRRIREERRVCDHDKE